MTNDTITQAHGRWREILPALGLPAASLSGKHGPCPMCGGKDRFRFSNRTNEGDYFCSMCGAGKGMQLLSRYHGWDFRRAAEEVDKIIGNLPPPSDKSPEFYQTQAANPGVLRRLYASSTAIADGDPVSLYLAKRNLAGRPWPKALRFIPRMKNGTTQTYHPGMLAVFSDASGKPSTIHRTFLKSDGTKADCDPVRMFMPGKVPVGGAIRLGEPSMIMGVAEGIETALSASILCEMPVWATTSNTLLQSWRPPPGVERLVIFADNDTNFVGQCSAFELAKSIVENHDGIKVEVKLPMVEGYDWNDVLCSQYIGELHNA
jgi:putative DNA primase/helicase